MAERSPITLLRRLWASDPVFLAVLTALGCWLVAPAFDAGILADNDFVAHYATTVILLEDHLPGTGALSGWTPRFNMGAPFLLFNPPPLLYLLAAAHTGLIGIPPELALKLLLAGAYLSVPWLGWLLASDLETTPSAFPRCAALVATCFSSELFGLEFFFKNGMANAAFALPLLLAVLVVGGRVIRSGARLSRVAVGAVLVALLVLCHLLSAYLAGVALAVLLLASPPRRWGPAALSLAVMAVVAVLLTGAWLVPSLAVAGDPPVVFTWIRRPGWVIESFLSGELFTSYTAFFYPRFLVQSHLGAAVTLLGALGVAVAVRERSRPVLGLVAVVIVALWIALGPAAAGPLVWLPSYDHLLWYRATTLVVFGWVVVAGFGLSRLLTPGPGAWWAARVGLLLLGGWVVVHWEATSWATIGLGLAYAAMVFADRTPRVAHYAVGVVLAFQVWALPELARRSDGILTGADYAAELADIDHIGEWLAEHGDRDARVYGEFLVHNIDDAVSVNALRHLVPLRSGMDEVGGWIFEHNRTSQVLLERGPFWFDPFPLLRDHARYDLGYLVAASPDLVGALAADPRWVETTRAGRLVLFEALDFTPARVVGPGAVSALERQPVRGGGRAISFEVDQPGTYLVKTNGSPHWSGSVAGAPVELQTTAEGLLQVEVPAAGRVELVWGLPVHRGVGRVCTALGLVALLGLWLARRRELRGEVAWWAGVAVVPVALVLCGLVPGERDPDRLGFGLRDGLQAAFPVDELDVGAWDDTVGAGVNRVVGDEWSPRLFWRGRAGRALVRQQRPGVEVVVAPERPAHLVVDGEPMRGGTTLLDVAVVDLGTGELVVQSSIRPGTPLRLPPIPVGSAGVPGVELGLVLGADEPVVLTRVLVDDGIEWLEGESLRNVSRDGGADARLIVGTPGTSPHDGALVSARVDRRGSPVRLVGEVQLGRGHYQVWARILGVAQGQHRAAIEVRVGGSSVGSVDGVGLVVDEPELVWVEVGELPLAGRTEVEVEVHNDTSEPAWFDLDLLAFVPVGLARSEGAGGQGR